MADRPAAARAGLTEQWSQPKRWRWRATPPRAEFAKPLAGVSRRHRSGGPGGRADRADRRRALHRLSAARAASSGCTTTPAPGRFLLPGDLEGSPLLTFFPMPLASEERPPRGSLAAMMTRRFESYKIARRAAVLQRPLRPPRPADRARRCAWARSIAAAPPSPICERAMTAILKAFRPGANSWLALRARQEDRSRAVCRDEGRPSARIQPRAPRCDPEANRRRGDRAGRNRRRRGFGAGALGIAGNARDDGDARTARRFPVSEARRSRASASAR